jgi:hypothetical protein
LAADLSGGAAAMREGARRNRLTKKALSLRNKRRNAMSDHDRERETTTIVTTDGGGRGGGTVIAVILLIAVLALLFYLFGGNLMGGGGETTDVKVDIAAPTGGGSGS